MDKVFFPVVPTSVPLFIDKITPGLNQIERPGDFSNDDVFTELMNGRSTLFMLSINGIYSGFVVLQEITEFANKRCHIWLCFSPTHQDVLTIFDPEITQCAKAMNASCISFSSSRTAWQKVAPKHGFISRETVFTRPVIH